MIKLDTPSLQLLLGCCRIDPSPTQTALGKAKVCIRSYSQILFLHLVTDFNTRLNNPGPIWDSTQLVRQAARRDISDCAGRRFIYSFRGGRVQNLRTYFWICLVISRGFQHSTPLCGSFDAQSFTNRARFSTISGGGESKRDSNPDPAFCGCI
jgi:hypothetical protein